MIDLSLTPEQHEIMAGAATLLREQSPLSRFRPGAAAVDVHHLLADWGWFGVSLPESQGGFGLGIAEETLLYVEAGRFLLSPSVLATSLAARLVDESTRADLISGRQTAAIVLSADEQGTRYCFDRGHAQLLVLIGSQSVSLHSAMGFRGERIGGLDESVVLEKGTLEGESLAAKPSHRGVLLTTAMLVGIAKASCDLAVEYAKVREQFGQPIGAFQAIKHRCADMAVRAYAAEAQLLMAAVASAHDVQSSPFQVASAAHVAIAAARTNGAAAIQVHGGMGFRTECDAHLYLKRAHVLGMLIGGIEAQRQSLLACAAPAAA